MRKKSGFLTFLLSFVPGFGHFYVGYATRGFIFFAFSIAIIFVAVMMGVYHFLSPILPLTALVLLWMVSMFDAMILVDRKNNIYYSYYYKNKEEINVIDPNLSDKQNRLEQGRFDPASIERQNRKVKSMLLSVLPGVGHLYLGLQRQGIELMLSFFLVFFLTDWLRLSIFMVFAPVIWFYSMFDVMHKVTGSREMKDEDIFAFKLPVIEDFINRSKGKLLGWVLIGLGAIVILNRVLFPAVSRFISYEYINLFQTGIVAVLLIFGGVKLISVKDNEVVEE